MRIKDKVQKKLLWSPGAKAEAVLAAMLLILLLIPLVRIALYSAPWYDDYGYGGFVKDFLEQDFSLKSALNGAVHCVKTQWYAWQGTFSSIFFMSLMPAVWGEEYYFLGPLFLVGILTIAILIFSKVLVRELLGADQVSAITLACGVTAMVMVMIHQPQQGFYWYNAGIHYIGMHAFLILLIAAWVKLLGCRGKWKITLLTSWSLLGAVLAGGQIM